MFIKTTMKFITEDYPCLFNSFQNNFQKKQTETPNKIITVFKMSTTLIFEYHYVRVSNNILRTDTVINAMLYHIIFTITSCVIIITILKCYHYVWYKTNDVYKRINFRFNISFVFVYVILMNEFHKYLNKYLFNIKECITILGVYNQFWKQFTHRNKSCWHTN